MKTRENELHEPILCMVDIYKKPYEKSVDVVVVGSEPYLGCPVCYYKWKLKDDDYNYCPNCGARLKEI